MSPPPDLGKYIKSTTYCTVIPTLRLMHCTDASQALSPARWMHFRGSSCTCPRPLCRCSPGHTWCSPVGSKDSSLEGAGDGQISFGSTLLSDHFPLHHLEGSRKIKACYTQVPIHMSKKPGTGSGGMLELEGTSGVTQSPSEAREGKGLAHRHWTVADPRAHDARPFPSLLGRLEPPLSPLLIQTPETLRMSSPPGQLQPGGLSFHFRSLPNG